MKLAKAKFAEDVAHLRDRFNKPTAEDYLFNTPWHGKKAVPSDGFPHYALQVWESIKNNSDLNLPSQKEMLATYRCDEISVTAFNNFKASVQPVQKKVLEIHTTSHRDISPAAVCSVCCVFRLVTRTWTISENRPQHY